MNKEFEQLCSFSYGNTINSNLTFTPSFTFAVGLLSIIATKIRRFLFKNKINFLFLGWILSFELTTVQRKTIDHLQVWGLKILQLKFQWQNSLMCFSYHANLIHYILFGIEKWWLFGKDHQVFWSGQGTQLNDFDQIRQERVRDPFRVIINSGSLFLR